MPPTDLDGASHLRDHVIICGFGRIGQSVAHLLDEERIPYISLDLDPVRVREAHAAGEPVFFGDATERDVLDAVGLAHARLVVISHDDLSAALKVLELLRTARPNLPTMVRTRDETHVRELEAAGALEVVPETLEAGLMIASQALLLLDVPRSRVMRRIQEQRSSRYRLMREFFRGDILSQNPEDRDTHHLRSMVVAAQCRAVGRPLGDLRLDDVAITALVRAGNRTPAPDPETKLVAGDVLILHGPLAELKRIETRLTA